MPTSPYTYTYDQELLFWALATLIIGLTVVAVWFTATSWGRRTKPSTTPPAKALAAYNFRADDD